MAKITENDVYEFVKESNRIERIDREPTGFELQVSARFLELPNVGIVDLEEFVSICQHGARLRTQPGMNVIIGNHLPPPGGPDIIPALADILEDANAGKNPWQVHVDYETLHPFIDGNGRSGRILWAWQMMKTGWHPRDGLSFLHYFYYQSLQNARP